MTRSLLPLRQSLLALASLASLAVWSSLTATTALAFPSVFPTGTTIYDPAKAYNSYVLFSSPDRKTHLIDLDGNEVHQWPYFGFPPLLLAPDLAGGKRGNLIVHLVDGEGQWNGIFNNKTIGEVDWDGRVVWQWGPQAPGGEVLQTHDIGRLANGNTLVLATYRHEIPSLVPGKVIGDQAIYEVTPKGEIAWKWVASDHLKEFGIPEEGLTRLRKELSQGIGVADGFLTINDMKVVGPNPLFDAGDARFHPDNLIIDARNANFIAVIDKKTGKIAWRLGPDYVEGEGSPHKRVLGSKLPRPVDQLSGQHDAQIIPKGLPGEGHILVFDNQGGAGYPPAALGIFSASRILEIDPLKKEIVWQYTAAASDRPIWAFHSSFISSARRLPNGNTLIDEGMNGRFFQITPQGEIVWEYVSPYFAQVTLRGQEALTNWVYRAIPIPYDWAPEGTPHSEKPVIPPDLAKFRVPAPAATP